MGVFFIQVFFFIQMPGFMIGFGFGCNSGPIFRIPNIPPIDFSASSPSPSKQISATQNLGIQVVGSVMKDQLIKATIKLNQHKTVTHRFNEYKDQKIQIDEKNGASYDYDFDREQLESLIPVFLWVNQTSRMKSFLSPSTTHVSKIYGVIPQNYKIASPEPFGYIYNKKVKDSKLLRVYVSNRHHLYLDESKPQKNMKLYRKAEWNENVQSIYVPTKGPFSSKLINNQFIQVFI